MIDCLIIGLNLIAIGAVYYGFKVWLPFEIQNAVKHQYDKLLEEYKRSLANKKKAALVAELLSEWLFYPKDYKLNLKNENI